MGMEGLKYYEVVGWFVGWLDGWMGFCWELARIWW